MLTAAAESHITPWGIVLVVLTLLGGLAAIQQLWSLVVGRRRRRAQEKIFDALADKLDAAEAHEQLSELKRLVDRLEREVREDIPLAARRAFLREQRDALAAAIGKNYLELTSIEAELGSDPAPGLHDDLRTAIEDRLVPHIRETDRRIGILVLLVSLILIWIVLPFGSRELTYVMLRAMRESSAYPPFTVSIVAALWSGVFALAAAQVAARQVVRRQLSRLGGKTRAALVAATLGVGIAFFVGAGIHAGLELRASEAAKGENEMVAKELPVSSPENVSPPTTMVPNPKFHRYDNRGVGDLLWLGAASTGIAAGAALHTLRGQRHRMQVFGT